ncbi:MAG: RNA-binding protein [Pseudolabrys sp.]|nr:RNA-binding protein [Pseudolabrys sp.]
MLAVAQDNELDRGAAKVASGDERFCALTRTAKPVDEMIRFVVGPQDEAVPDIKRKLPGRGLWITATHAAVAEAVRRNVFARGFKRAVRADAALADRTGELLGRAALDALAIAAKAGRVVTGFGKVEDATVQPDLAAVLAAADGAADGKRKIAAALRRSATERAGAVPIVGCFTSAQLDLALNRLNVVHAALLDGPVSETFLARTARFERYRAENPGETDRNHLEQSPVAAAEDERTA